MFNFEVAHTLSLGTSSMFVMHSKEPSWKPKKNPLPTGACKHLKRILGGQECMMQLDKNIIDCLNHVRAIQWNRHATWKPTMTFAQLFAILAQQGNYMMDTLQIPISGLNAMVSPIITRNSLTCFMQRAETIIPSCNDDLLATQW